MAKSKHILWLKVYKGHYDLDYQKPWFLLLARERF